MQGSISFVRVLGLLVLLEASSTSVGAFGVFRDDFSGISTIEESATMSESRNPDWWLNSGAYVLEDNGIGRTVQGPLPADDRWRLAYASSNPLDTGNGYWPQNLLRMVTRERWLEFNQTVRFRVRRTNLTDTANRGAWSGLLLFIRYQDGDNLYYAGLRHDGAAVIKKKRFGRYSTLAYQRIYAGTYDRWMNPNLLPQDQWIQLRAVTTDEPGGDVRIRLEMNEESLGPGWITVLDAVDDGSTNGSVISTPGYAGVRGDFMDLELDEFTVDPIGGETTLPHGWPVAVFRPGDRSWLFDFDRDGAPDRSLVYGATGDVPVPADYDGDGVIDPALFRPRRGDWLVDTDRNGRTDLRVRLGSRDDVPVPADFDGDGRIDIATFRRGDGSWRIDLDRDGGVDRKVAYGRSGDVPLAGDYDGDGVADLAVYRPSLGAWFVDLNRNGGTNLHAILGESGDLPVPMDYDGDGKVDFAVFDPGNGTWRIDVDRDCVADLRIVYGRSGDVPVAADYDGDGAADLAVFRPAYGGWFLDTDRNGGTDVKVLLGEPGDIPLRPNGSAIAPLLR